MSARDREVNYYINYGVSEENIEASEATLPTYEEAMGLGDYSSNKNGLNTLRVPSGLDEVDVHGASSAQTSSSSSLNRQFGSRKFPTVFPRQSPIPSPRQSPRPSPRQSPRPSPRSSPTSNFSTQPSTTSISHSRTPQYATRDRRIPIRPQRTASLQQTQTGRKSGDMCVMKFAVIMVLLLILIITTVVLTRNRASGYSY